MYELIIYLRIYLLTNQRYHYMDSQCKILDILGWYWVQNVSKVMLVNEYVILTTMDGHSKSRISYNVME